MRTASVIVRPEDLEEFIRREGATFDMKDYEFHAALVLARFLEKQHGGKHLIGFPVRREQVREMAQEDTWEYLRTILRDCLQQDSPFDVMIVSEKNVEDRGYKPPHGSAFQLKRLISPARDATDFVVGYLNEVVPRKYGRIPDAQLVLLLESKDGEGLQINLDHVRDRFRADTFPLGRAMFILTGDGKIVVGEFWPNFGRAEYSYGEWFG